MDSLTFLAKSDSAKIRPIYVVHGDEDFLKRRVLQALRVLVLGEQADELSLSSYAGDHVDYATVMDDVRTIPFFGPRRLVMVESADPFVSAYRAALEKAVANLPESGVLVLEVKSWPANTRLAKLIDDRSTIVCKALPTARLPAWCVDCAKAQHGKQLTGAAAELLVELVGQEMGLLDQELQKLATYVGDRARIDEKDVDQLVGRSQAQEIWQIFDDIAAGNARGALEILGRLLDQGEEPMRIIGGMGSKLRQLAQAGRLAQQHRPAPAALADAGMRDFAIAGGVKLLKHFGRARVGRLYDWLLQINMDLRGDSPLPERALLERLVVRLARKQEGP